MSQLRVPEFETYEEEAEFWDALDTAEHMEDDGEWFRFETESKRAVRVAILPEIISRLARQARNQGVSIETLINARLLESMGKAPGAA